MQIVSEDLGSSFQQPVYNFSWNKYNGCLPTLDIWKIRTESYNIMVDDLQWLTLLKTIET